MQDDKLEHTLSTAIDDDITKMAQKLAPMPQGTPPRDYAKSVVAPAPAPVAPTQEQPHKRVLSPTDHFSESLASLTKTLETALSLRTKLLGPSSAPKGKSLIDNNAEPSVILLHKQADEVARLSAEITAVVSQIRSAL